jgi:hypothetical protein
MKPYLIQLSGDLNLELARKLVRQIQPGRVGTGFSERALAELYGGLQKIRRATCPFVSLPEKRRDRWGQGHPSGDEALPLGRTGLGRPRQVYRVDQRRSASSTCLPGTAHR